MYAALAVFLFLGDTLWVLGDEFSYEGELGPYHWKEIYLNCTGKLQSPIDIEENDVENMSFPLLMFSGLNVTHDTYIKNNGHTVMLRMKNSEEIIISRGPLIGDKYVFEQLHFHWGENDTSGSENMENNHSFAMELHAVFYNKKYGSMSAANNYTDGLAVLAYFVEASDQDNLGFLEIISALDEIQDHLEYNVKLQNEIMLDQILLSDTSFVQDYFTYRGSLTTPPCYEIVTWIDFKQPLSLSHKQIAAFRKIHDSHHNAVTHNDRPIQERGNRIIYHNVPSSSLH